MKKEFWKRQLVTACAQLAFSILFTPDSYLYTLTVLSPTHGMVLPLFSVGLLTLITIFLIFPQTCSEVYLFTECFKSLLVMSQWPFPTRVHLLPMNVTSFENNFVDMIKLRIAHVKLLYSYLFVVTDVIKHTDKNWLREK